MTSTIRSVLDVYTNREYVFMHSDLNVSVVKTKLDRPAHHEAINMD